MSNSLDIAEDFRNSLEELTFNSRWEIVNLTTIARENILHAQAIAKVIQDQIKTVNPSRKLPTFYLLDSIVKNVGTPYTLYFGRDLCPLFMAAYVVVDGQVRRKLEEMLQTWKQPLPGAMNSQPVFPPEVTYKIDQILTKARMAGMQAQPSLIRPAQPPMPIAHHPMRPFSSNPQYPQQMPPVQQPVYPQQPPSQNGYYPQSQGPAYAQSPLPRGEQYMPPNPTPGPFPQSVIPHAHMNVDSLRADLTALINSAKADWARNMNDPSTGSHLKNLLDLEQIISTQVLGPDQYAAVRTRLNELSQANNQSLPTQQHHMQHNLAGQQLGQSPLRHPLSPTQAQTPQQGLTLDSLLGTGSIAALLASARPQSVQPTPPPQQVIANQLRSPLLPSGPIMPTSTPDQSSATDLLNAFKAAGVLPAAPAASQSTLSSLAFLSSLQRNPTPLDRPLSTKPLPKGFNPLPEIVPLTAASLKVERPQLIHALFSDRGKPCNNCGRRYPPSEEGKKRKAAHLDWHFKTSQRMVEATKRGQYRCWYVDEHEWIKSAPLDLDEDLAANAGASKDAESGRTNGLEGGAAAAKKKERYVPIPSDSSANTTCPVCMERFSPSWHEPTQQFVYLDAVKAGHKIYHQSCFDAIRSVHAMETSRTSTPDSVGKKRKAEVSASPRVKMLKELEA